MKFKNLIRAMHWLLLPYYNNSFPALCYYKDFREKFLRFNVDVAEFLKFSTFGIANIKQQSYCCISIVGVKGIYHENFSFKIVVAKVNKFSNAASPVLRDL